MINLLSRFTVGTTLALLSLSNVANAQWTKKYVPLEVGQARDIKSYNNQLYLSSQKGIFKSIDNGNTWIELTFGFQLPAYSLFNEMVFIKGGNIYVKNHNYCLIRSMDGGSTWEYDSAGIGNNFIKSMFYDAATDKMFIGLETPINKGLGLFYKTPADSSWTRINSPAFADRFIPNQITKNGNNLYIIDDSRNVYESIDSGNSWVKKISDNLPYVSASNGATRFLSIDEELYIAGGGFTNNPIVCKSPNGGDSWTKLDNGFVASYPGIIGVSGFYYDGGNLYASLSSSNRVYVSVNKGNTWVETGILSHSLISFTKHYNFIYAAGYESDSIFVYKIGSTGIENNALIKHESIKVHPNPTNDFISIETNLTNTNNTFVIADYIGKQVITGEVTNENNLVDLRHLSAGIYFLKFEEHHKRSIKIIKY